VNSIIITADAQEKDWREFHTVWHATDFLSASVVSNRTGDAQDAARFLLENPSDVSVSALSLARSIAPGGTSEQGDFDENWAEVVRRLRTSLATDPRSAMQWSDLALAHTVLGNRRNALRSMNVAISLAPDNRFVLRTAARCFQHWESPIVRMLCSDHPPRPFEIRGCSRRKSQSLLHANVHQLSLLLVGAW
jgi:hypothetical protein